MEAKKDTPPPIIDQLKEYAETRIKLAKYQAIEGGSSIAAGIIADIAVIVSMVLAFIFASFTLAFYLAQVLNSYWMGFGCVALIYLIIAFAVKYNRHALEKPIVNAFIHKIFKN
ncbi:phage holin family protein [Mucilaginibacter sp.]|uniref:phage holin family protein n=1 Tax=Mucilaginibacter sp. TaxID=1882438 RepID=UPI003D10687B